MNLNRNEVEYLINLTLKDVRRNMVSNPEIDKMRVFNELKKNFPRAVKPFEHEDFKKCRDIIKYILKKHSVNDPEEMYEIYLSLIGDDEPKWKKNTFERETYRMKDKGLMKEMGEELVLC